jgi:segregation and condensation protein A
VTDAKPSFYVVHTTTFDGPLDQLLQRAQQGEVDLQTIPLAEIAADYLAHSRRAFDVEDATETLWTLAALIELKARALLPQAPPPEEPPADEPGDLDALLEERLTAYRAFKDVATALRALEAFQQKVFLRPADEPQDPLLSGIALTDLFRAFQEVLSRREAKEEEVPVEGITVADQMTAVLALLAEVVDGLPFEGLFPAEATRLEIVVTFLALLELIRLFRVRVRQDGPFGIIRVYSHKPEGGEDETGRSGRR